MLFIFAITDMHNPCERGIKYLCRECLEQILESHTIRKCVGHAILYLSLALKRPYFKIISNERQEPYSQV
jgi:hypothetical protein